MAQSSELCANCGHTIGRLEKAYTWQNNVVCFECRSRLEKQGTAERARTRVAAGDDEATEAAIYDDTHEFGKAPSPIDGFGPGYSQSTSCPSCGSTDTQRISMAHAQGTSETTGIAIGGIGDDLAGGMFSSASRTNLAAQLAPPKEPNTSAAFGLIAAGVIAILCAMVVISMNESSMATIPGVLGAVGLLLGIIRARGLKAERREYDILYAAWTRRWICKRCGIQFKV